MAPPARRQLPRNAKIDAAEEGAYSTASMRQPNTGKIQPIKNSAEDTDATPKDRKSSMATDPRSRLPFPNLRGSAEYVGKGTDHDKRNDDRHVDDEMKDDLFEDVDETRAPTGKRDDSARQTILENDPKYFIKQQAEKDKRDRKAAAAAPGATDDDEVISVANRPAANKVASKETKAKTPGPTTAVATVSDDEEQTQVTPDLGTEVPASKKTVAKGPASTTKTGQAAKPPTIVKGVLGKQAKVAASTKSERVHRKKDFDYKSASSESEKEEGTRETIAKLRETIDRHARWCPFVHLNKKVHNMYRKMKLMEEVEEQDEEAQAGKGKATKNQGHKDDKNGKSKNKDDKTAAAAKKEGVKKPSRSNKPPQSAASAAGKASEKTDTATKKSKTSATHDDEADQGMADNASNLENLQSDALDNASQSEDDDSSIPHVSAGNADEESRLAIALQESIETYEEEEEVREKSKGKGKGKGKEPERGSPATGKGAGGRKRLIETEDEDEDDKPAIPKGKPVKRVKGSGPGPKKRLDFST